MNRRIRFYRPLLAALALIVPLLLAHGLAGTVQAQATPAWVGEYYNNTTLTGSPVAVRVDQNINFSWAAGSPSPTGQAEMFSVRWTTARQFSAGMYRITVRNDDGVRVLLDGQQVINAWYDQAPDPAIVADVNISAGIHALVVEYYNNIGPGVIQVDIALLSGNTGTIWVAQYYNNTSLSGAPALERTENTIDYNWDYGSPQVGVINADNFSARWTGSPVFNAGTYVFTLNADDGVRLYVDGVLVIDRWVLSGFTPAVTVTVNLAAGQHAVRVEYFEALEIAAVRLAWQLAGTIPPTPLPTPVPSPAPLPTQPPPVSGLWQAQYFNNTELAGAAVFSEQFSSADLDLAWGTGSPNPVVIADNFSGRFSRTVTFSGSNVRFAVRADDGVRFYLDGQALLNEWHVASGRPYFIDRAVPAGNHAVTVEFYEGVRQASLEFYWVYPLAAQQVNYGVTAQVRANLLNVRNGPGVNYPVIERIPQNAIYTVTARFDSTLTWWRINIGSIQGWVSNNWMNVQGNTALVPVLTEAQAGSGVTLGQPTGLRIQANVSLNIRSGPGLAYPIIGYFIQGTTLDVIGRSSDNAWYEVNFEGGRGWVAGRQYVRATGNTAAVVPVTG